MKIYGFCCSPRKEMTTHFALTRALAAAREEAKDALVELVDLAPLDIGVCTGCNACMDSDECAIQDDFNETILAKLKDPELGGIIVATPVYMGSMTSLCKAFLDRSVVLRRHGYLLRNKVGGALAVGNSRNGGQELTLQAVHAAFLIQDMILVGDGLQTSHFGGTLWSGIEGGVEQDQIGIGIAENLGRRVAQVTRKLMA